MLSSDVNSAFDPNYANVNEKKNTAYFGKGVVFMKYTGSRGKSGSNDASAEYIGKLRKIMDENNIFKYVCYLKFHINFVVQFKVNLSNQLAAFTELTVCTHFSNKMSSLKVC